MNKFKIGIVGNGFVGSAICKGLNHYHDVKIYDVNSAKSTHSSFVSVDFFICIAICVTCLVNYYSNSII